MKDQEKKSTQDVRKAICALKGSNVCPNPKECDGLERKCTVWQSHSAK